MNSNAWGRRASLCLLHPPQRCHRLQGVCMVAGGAQAWQGTGPPTYRPWTSVSPVGFFFEPTIFTDVEDHMSIAKEESFGPVMIISRFADG